MATIHIVMQAKGGVGKSFVSFLLYQYIEQRHLLVKGYDTDPSNASFRGFAALDVSIIHLMDGMDIDPRGFDQLFSAINALPQEAHAVIDNGTSSYFAFCAYMVECGTFAMLKNQGHAILLHCLITGGNALIDNLNNLEGIIKNFPKTPLIAWLNPKDGPVEFKGKSFADFKTFRENSSAFHAVIELPDLPQRQPRTYGRDLNELVTRRHTFAQAFDDPSLSLAEKQRLLILWRDYIAVMDEADIC